MTKPILSYTRAPATGSTIFDQSGNGNHGTINGSPNRQKNSFMGELVLDLDGVDDYIRTPDSTTLNNIFSGDFTVCFWMKKKTINTNSFDNVTMKYDAASTDDMFRLFFDDRSTQSRSNALLFIMSNTSSQFFLATKQDYFENTGWYYVCARIIGNEMTLWRNCEQVANVTFTGTRHSSNAYDLTIGTADTAPNFTDMVFDKYKVYDSGISQEEMKKNYKSTFRQ